MFDLHVAGCVANFDRNPSIPTACATENTPVHHYCLSQAACNVFATIASCAVAMPAADPVRT